MVRVKDLRALLSGLNGEFNIESISSVKVDYDTKSVRFITIPYPTDKDFDFVTPPPEPNRDRFVPVQTGWSEENDFYYDKWKNGGNDLTYLQELGEIDRIKKQNKHVTDDTGSNTLPMDM